MPPIPQEIWRGDKHAGGDDLGVHAGYENRNAFVRQHFGPNLLGSLFRLHVRAYFRESIEFEQRSKVNGWGRSCDEAQVARCEDDLAMTVEIRADPFPWA